MASIFGHHRCQQRSVISAESIIWIWKVWFKPPTTRKIQYNLIYTSKISYPCFKTPASAPNPNRRWALQPQSSSSSWKTNSRTLKRPSRLRWAKSHRTVRLSMPTLQKFSSLKVASRYLRIASRTCRRNSTFSDRCSRIRLSSSPPEKCPRKSWNAQGRSNNRFWRLLTSLSPLKSRPPIQRGPSKRQSATRFPLRARSSLQRSKTKLTRLLRGSSRIFSLGKSWKKLADDS